jgi:hypothetical protein
MLPRLVASALRQTQQLAAAAAAVPAVPTATAIMAHLVILRLVLVDRAMPGSVVLVARRLLAPALMAPSWPAA